MRPVYIEKSDRRGKKAAHAAFCKLLRQHPSIGDEEFTVTTADIYELRKIARWQNERPRGHGFRGSRF